MLHVLKQFLFPLYIIAHILVGFASPTLLAFLPPLLTIIIIASAVTPREFREILNRPIFQTSIIISISLLMSCLTSSNPAISLSHASEASLALLCFAIMFSVPDKWTNNLTIPRQKFILSLLTAALLTLTFLMLAIKTNWLTWAPQTLSYQPLIATLIFWPIILIMDKNRFPIWHGINFVLTCTICYLAPSAIPSVILIASTASYIFFKYLPFSQLTKTGLFASLILILILTPLLLVSNSLEGLGHILDPFLHNNYQTINLWISYFKDMSQHFPFGAGICFSEFKDISGAALNQITTNQFSNNLTLELGRDLGILGFVLTALGIFGLIYLFHNSVKQHQAAVAALLISNTVLYSLAFSIWHEWRSALTAFTIIVAHTASRKKISLKSHRRDMPAE